MQTTEKVATFVRGARKFLVALSAALAILTVALADNTLTTVEIINTVLSFLGAAGVYQVGNDQTPPTQAA